MDLLAQYSDASGEGGAGDGDTDDDVATTAAMLRAKHAVPDLAPRVNDAGLAVAGECGVAHVLETLRREIDLVMGLTGISRIADIGPDILMQVPQHLTPTEIRPAMPAALGGAAGD